MSTLYSWDATAITSITCTSHEALYARHRGWPWGPPFGAQAVYLRPLGKIMDKCWDSYYTKILFFALMHHYILYPCSLLVLNIYASNVNLKIEIISDTMYNRCWPKGRPSPSMPGIEGHQESIYKCWDSYYTKILFFALMHHYIL